MKSLYVWARAVFLTILIGVLPSVSVAQVSQKTEKVVAVAEIKVTVPAAKLVYTPESVRDVVTGALVETGQVKVIDWARLSEVLFRRNLDWSDVVEKDGERKAVKEVLLNDYFLVGSVSAYSEHWDYQSGAFSKSKTQVVRVQIDLFIKDALTNEIVVSSRGQAKREKEVSQTLGFGASGGSDSTLALDALNEGAQQAIKKLMVALKPAEKKPGSSSMGGHKTNQSDSSVEEVSDGQ